MALSHISRSIKDVTGKTFARKFITLGRVITYWPQAVGPDLAAKTYPIGMKVRKAPAPKKTGKAAKADPQATSPITHTQLEAVLEIAASSADATLIHYQKGLILERLRTLLGAAMIVDIRITHNAMAPIMPAPAAPLTDRAEPCLSAATAIVTDDELRFALENLLHSVSRPTN